MKIHRFSIKSLNVVVALFLLAAGIAPPAAFSSATCCMMGPQQPKGSRNHPEGERDFKPPCPCCANKSAPCDVDEGPPEMPQDMVFATPRAEGLSFFVLSVHTICGPPYFDAVRPSIRTAGIAGADPPLPLFLLNLSFLC